MGGGGRGGMLTVLNLFKSSIDNNTSYLNNHVLLWSRVLTSMRA